MTQEEKQILLNDSKCRLYTGTKCLCIWADAAENGSAGAINELDTYILDELEMIDNPDCEHMFSDIKPYLRSMESMTEEEYNEFFNYYHAIEEEFLKNSNYTDYLGAAYAGDNAKYEWLNEHHFDYRGLIKLSLALEAPEGMYNYYGQSSKPGIGNQPHEGDPDNPYDMSFEDAQQYASRRGIDIPINDGDVFVDERHITQTIGNILRWADEHPTNVTNYWK